MKFCRYFMSDPVLRYAVDIMLESCLKVILKKKNLQIKFNKAHKLKQLMDHVVTKEHIFSFFLLHMPDIQTLHFSTLYFCQFFSFQSLGRITKHFIQWLETWDVKFFVRKFYSKVFFFFNEQKAPMIDGWKLYKN